MNSIVSVTQNLLKTSQSFIHFEEQLVPCIAELVCAQVAEALEAYDETLCLHQGQHILRRDSRSIQCLFGTLVFRRRLVQDDTGRSFYPLDQALGLPRARRYSPLLMTCIAELAAHTVLRTVAKAVQVLTPGAISFQTVGKIYCAVGTDLDEVAEAEEAAISDEPKRVVSKLFIEGDAFQVKIKHHQRVMVHRLQLSEGVVQTGKRRALIHRHVVSGLNRQQVFSEMWAYLDQHYDRRDVQIVSGSDNGSGYEPEAFNVFANSRQRHVHVIDVYHLNRKLKERFWSMPAALKDRLRQAVLAGNWNQVEVTLTTATALATGGGYRDEVVENVRQLQGYLSRNWTSIVALSSTNWQHSGLGSCESNHRAYTYRLKKQGKSWSSRGLGAMLRIIDAIQNQTLSQAVSTTALFDTLQPESVTATPNRGAKAFKLRALFTTPEHTDHLGVMHGRINAQGVTGTAFGRLAKALNNLA